jgi:hypothetical protein
MIFYDSILQGVVRDDTQAASGVQELRALVEKNSQVAQFLINGNTQGLEGSGCRMDAAVLRGDGFFDYRHQLAGGPDGRPLALANDIFGDPAGPPFFSVLLEKGANLFGRKIL